MRFWGELLPLKLVDLDERTRAEMQAELEQDLTDGTLYLAGRLSAIGRSAYPDLIAETFARYDDAWLAAELRSDGRLNARETSHSRTGALIRKAVPNDAANTLAEGEFNRYYLRGVCRRALREGTGLIEVYRAKDVAEPRLESEALVGRRLHAADLLVDLRTHIAVDTALGLPSGPNSGLSGRLIPRD